MKKIILSALMLTGMLTFAQDGKLTVSGTVDVYGTVNTVDGPGAPGLLVADAIVPVANAFGLGMANTIFTYETGNTGVVVDLAFGPKAIDAAGNSNINQLYAYYSVNDALTITAGQFNTFLGYEVISPAANFNYTVSYLFNAGPFSHVGVKADYAVSEDLSLMLAITNPHGEFAQQYGSGNAQLGFQVGYKGQYLNIAYGADGSMNGVTPVNDALYIDYTGGFDITESTYLGINAAYAKAESTDQGYNGVALYLQQAISDSFALGLRPEYFAGNSVAKNAVTAVTLTANTALTDNLSVIADLRIDSSDDGIIEGSAEDSFTQFTVAAVYSF